MSDAAIRASVSRETMARLEAFVTLLGQWNDKIGLIARSDETCVWNRHVADSLQLVRYIPVEARMLVDCGSGAGFPGLVVAIASDRHVHLIESDRRKASFLREAARITGAAVTVHAARCETMTLPVADVLTARGLAPLKDLLPLVQDLVDERTQLLLLKGKDVDRELAAVSADWRMQVRRYPSQTGAGGTLVAMSGLRRVA